MPYKDVEKRRAHGREAQRRYRERHPDRVRTAVQKWERAHPESSVARAERRLTRDPDWRRRYWYGRQYGITLEERESLFASQGGLCAICRIGPAEHIDHDHVSGVVRGMLCGSCNRAVGLFDDDPDRLRAAIEYLSK